jgi:hypothetical protein
MKTVFTYKNVAVLLPKAVFEQEEILKQNGGQNIKNFFLTIKCFKLLCLKAQTIKASEMAKFCLIGVN